MNNWFGKDCCYQICTYEGWWTEEGYEEDKSSPILIYCRHENNEEDCEGNCNRFQCPLIREKVEKLMMNSSGSIDGNYD